MHHKNIILAIIILGTLVFGGFIYLYGFDEPIIENDAPIRTSESISIQEPICGAGGSAMVTKVIDGDTIVVSGGWHVRILGIDADEKNEPCHDSAKTRLEELLLGKRIALQKDITDVDKYQRCLRNIFLGTENIAVQLAREGLVRATFYPPDEAYKNEIMLAQKEATDYNIGCKWEKVGR